MPSTYPELPMLPDWGMKRSTEPRVETISFGENYEQRIGRGINRTPKTLTLSFNNRRREPLEALEKFFEELGGVGKFSYAHLGGPSKTYVTLGKFEVTEVGYNRYTLTVTVKEVP